MTNKQRERQIRNECMILYREEGHTLKEVAELFRVSLTTARTVCGGETKAEKEKRNEDMRLYKAQGHTMQQVADKFNVTKHTAQMICKGIAPQKADIEPPNKGKLKGDDEVASFIAERLPGFEYAGNYTGGDGRVDLKCKECGTILNRSMITVRHRQLDCPECKRIEAERKAQAKRDHNAFKQNKARTRRDSVSFHKSSQMSIKFCAKCGEAFYTSDTHQVYCSKNCMLKMNNRVKEYRRRVRIADGLIDRDISLEILFKRDKGVCQICGGRCKWDDSQIKGDTFIAGLEYPSIDHIIPLAKGGVHSWDNVQLAHFQCNSIKSAKVYPLQNF